MAVIDVSYAQGKIDWAAVKKAGVTAAFIRCGYGQDYRSQDDSQYKRNIDGALAQGIKVGVYIYSYAASAEKARGEAKHAIRLVSPYKSKLTYPVFIDVEEKSKIKNSKPVCEAFLSEMHSAGYNAGVYTFDSCYNTYLKKLTGYDMLWIAKWGSKQPSVCDIWQYSEKGRISGINGNVDLDKIINDIKPDPDPKEDDKVNVELNVLRRGDKNAQVGNVQRILRERGYKHKNKLIVVDNNFGEATEACVKEFQKLWGLTVDGVVGLNTWNKILKG